MTTLTLRPLRPALSLPPAICTPNPTSQDRQTPTKLSLLIPAVAEPTPVLSLQTSSRGTGTPVCRRPKLSLNFGSDTKRTFVTSGSFSSSRLPTNSPSDDESNTSEEDITCRNTIANTHIKTYKPFERSMSWTRTYSYTQVSGKRSILKGSPSCTKPCEVTFASRCVSFQSEHVVIPSYVSMSDDEYEDIENLSPPSTTSSTDSDGSDSDSEPKTPVDEDEDCRGRSFDRFAAATSRSGKWRRPKREWVWTLGGSDKNDIMQELEYSSTNLMQVEAL